MLLLAYVSPFVSACQLTANSRRGGAPQPHNVGMPAPVPSNEELQRLAAILRDFDDAEVAIRRLPDDLQSVARAVHEGALTPAAVDDDVARALGRASAILARRMAGPPEGDLV